MAINRMQTKPAFSSTGATQDRWFSHLSVTVPKEGASRE